MRRILILGCAVGLGVLTLANPADPVTIAVRDAMVAAVVETAVTLRRIFHDEGATLLGALNGQ